MNFTNQLPFIKILPLKCSLKHLLYIVITISALDDMGKFHFLKIWNGPINETS